MKNLPITITLLFFSALMSLKASADDYQSVQTRVSQSNMFFTHESSGNDFYSGIGIGTTFTFNESDFGLNLSTSLSNAKVMTDLGFEERFMAWEGHVKVGYFSNFSLYGEFGFDIGELLNPDFRQIDDILFDAIGLNDEPENLGKSIDSYVGIGAGLNMGRLNISAFSRIRDIDSEYWQARNDTFTGLQFTYRF
ncbi:hypothetical protein FLL45_08810 [Aliikangiella marina]|uniref:Porin family protein n=1 Tax=Aliikangiella marina TaxID=1712262 RepID=A0A545TCW3_9GAMM|nr:hypothetical protein [Aliikangiella marina]TQV75031.1 hypothetical protein FLL45_08810 [Aliikangiella marina]